MCINKPSPGMRATRLGGDAGGCNVVMNVNNNRAYETIPPISPLLQPRGCGGGRLLTKKGLGGIQK